MTDDHAPAEAERSSSRGARAFWLATIAIVLIAVALRLYFGATYKVAAITWDWRIYEMLGRNLAKGNGYTSGSLDEVDKFFRHPGVPFANFPPLFPMVLGLLNRVGLSSLESHRAFLGVISAAGVLLMAMLGRRLGGPVLGIVAATIAAVHPLWVQPAGILMSESIYLIIIPGTLLLAVRLIDRPSNWTAAAVGALIGLATLTRSESIALLVALAVPTVLLAAKPASRRLVLGLCVIVGCAVFTGPWVARNYKEFGGLTLSTQQGLAFAATNCDETYTGDRLGGVSTDCYSKAVYAAPAQLPVGEKGNALAMSRVEQRQGLEYLSDHRGEVPKVVGARVLRGWSLFRTGDQLYYDVYVESRSSEWQTAGQYLHWVLLPLAVVGAALLPRSSWRRWSVLLAGPILFVVASAAAYGSVRVRTIAEPSIALFAAYALVRLFEMVRLRLRFTERDTSTPDRSTPNAAPVPDEDAGTTAPSPDGSRDEERSGVS